MATRVGKYKISKRESALNLTDGGTVNGALTITGNATINGSTITLDGLGSNVSASLGSNQLFLTGSNAFTSSAGGSLTMTNNDFNVVCITQ